MSAKFTDLKGREYRCVVTVGTVEKLKEELQLDIGDAIDGKLYDRLSDDWKLLVDVISIACEESISSHQITDPKDFASALNGDVLGAAFDAFMDAVADFSPPRKRQALRDAIGKMKEVEVEAVKQASVKIVAIDPEKIANQAVTNQTAAST